MPQEVIDFRTRSIMPEEDVDALWAARPGYLEAAVEGAMANITARLRKRYVTPFDPAGVIGPNPRPEIVVAWIAKLVTPEAYRARGVNPQDAEMKLIDDDRTNAIAEIKEAADAQGGLYDIPLLEAGDATGISKGGPLGYAEAGPYDWTDVQREAIDGS